MLCCCKLWHLNCDTENQFEVKTCFQKLCLKAERVLWSARNVWYMKHTERIYHGRWAFMIWKHTNRGNTGTKEEPYGARKMVHLAQYPVPDSGKGKCYREKALNWIYLEWPIPWHPPLCVLLVNILSIPESTVQYPPSNSKSHWNSDQTKVMNKREHLKVTQSEF